MSYLPQGSITSTASLRISTQSTTITSSTTLTASDYTVFCNAISSAITITLPTSVNISGTVYNIKKIDSSGNVIKIDGNGSETIDGSLIKSLTVQYESITVQSDGSNWNIL